jgi:1-acyl-sn-glycerol-3-phosphate acyltransferase
VVRYLRIPFQLAWRFWFYLHGAVIVILFYPAYFILLQRKRWFPYVFRLYDICGRIMLFNAGIRPRVERKFVPARGTPYVICANHASYLDIITTYIAVPEYFHFIGKAELRNIPLFGHFFREMNIPVDRGSIVSSHRAFTRAKEDIDKGISIAIFPEATIPETAPRLKPFKNGAFRLAIEKQVPIIPVVFLDNWKIMPDGILRRMQAGHPGRTRLIVYPPVETTGMAAGDVDTLKRTVFQLMDDSLRRHGVY